MSSIAVALLFGFLIIGNTQSAEPFAIRVVDDRSQRGVPMVELRTVGQLSYWTDSQGYAAIDEVGLMGEDFYFHVRSDGYEVPADGFGYRGVRLRVDAGEEAVVPIHRTNIASSRWQPRDPTAVGRCIRHRSHGMFIVTVG